MRRLGCAVLALVSLVACQGPPAQILVIVDAQPLVRSRAMRLDVRIWGRSRDEAQFGDEVVHSATQAVAPFSWPRTFAIAPVDQDPSRLWRFEATANDGRETFVVTRAVSGYQANRSLQVVLVLFDSCIGELCPDDLNTACDPITQGCVDAMRDPDMLGPLTDGGTYDAAFRGETCAVDADCDDELECTVDTCVAGGCAHEDSDLLCPNVGCARGSCVSGVCVNEPDDTNCNDGLDCTVDRCDVTGECMETPDDAVCDADPSGRCDVEEGCQYDTCTPANCTASGCTAATCVGTMCDRTFACVGAQSECCNDACVAPGCDDGNECTADSCGAMGCVSDGAALNGMPCNDGDPCTIDSRCNGGACGGGRDCMAQANPPCQSGMCTATGCQLVNNDGVMCPGGPVGCPNQCSGGVCRAQMCGTDAGPMPDAGMRDAGMRDAGMRDAGMPDAGMLDAGPPPLPDAGPPFCDTCTMMGQDCCLGVVCCDPSMGMCMGSACVPFAPDAGPMDAGGTPDAGGGPDGGPTMDGGGLDAAAGAPREPKPDF